ncbi:hypothetical protein [Aquimarina pacifica]|uniref:hypothetical protein n=1 Tax=Aquimarina pacifica TaxID=1296415 RepID=UPI0004716194|nr:hypothetical protein [Aquimarina pacifica]
MKNYLKTLILAFLFVGIYSCQKEDDSMYDQELSLEKETSLPDVTKSSPDILIVCSVDGIPNGYTVLEYINYSSECPNINLFFGQYNAAIVKRDGTPKIISAGPGCSDNYCIWIKGTNFESSSYVDIRTTTGSTIIGTYRGANRTLTTNAQGEQVITLRLGSSYERSQFAGNGLRIWVVNPIARKWADGRVVKRPGSIDPIDPPCNPICP